MAISPELFMAILSMDAYNRGYGAGIEDGGVSSQDGLGEAGYVGNARILSRASEIDVGDWQDAGFYAVAYEWQGQTVISYRGTNADSQGNFWTDVINGYLVGAGTSNNDQAHLAADFYQAVTGTSETDPSAATNIVLTGHSLGGGLASSRH